MPLVIEIGDKNSTKLVKNPQTVYTRPPPQNTHKLVTVRIHSVADRARHLMLNHVYSIHTGSAPSYFLQSKSTPLDRKYNTSHSKLNFITKQEKTVTFLFVVLSVSLTDVNGLFLP